MSSRCFVCRQSKQQLEEEQKRSLYGLESSGTVSGEARRPRCVLGGRGPVREPAHPPRPSLPHQASHLTQAATVGVWVGGAATVQAPGKSRGLETQRSPPSSGSLALRNCTAQERGWAASGEGAQCGLRDRPAARRGMGTAVLQELCSWTLQRLPQRTLGCHEASLFGSLPPLPSVKLTRGSQAGRRVRPCSGPLFQSPHGGGGPVSASRLGAGLRGGCP